MRYFCRALLLVSALISCHADGQIVVFQQAGFPTIDNEVIPQESITSALGAQTVSAGVEELKSGSGLKGARLLVLPYGSAFPAAAWPGIQRYLQEGGNLLLLGGQPMRVPVLGSHDGEFKIEAAQDSYSRAIDFRHSYAVPAEAANSAFHWRRGYTFLPSTQVRATRIFAQEGRLEGLGYMDANDGTHLAAPVIVADHAGGSSMPGSRIVALPFSADKAYWSSNDGISLIRTAAAYAQAGATSLQVELQYSAIRPGEMPEITLRLKQPHTASVDGTIDLRLRQGEKVLDHARLAASDLLDQSKAPFRESWPAGLYTIDATWTPAGSETPREYAENGFQVEELSALEVGAALHVNGDFLARDNKPFFPVGTNYFTTEENGWDFSGPRNAAVWERDFADMERHRVSFVRTGVWMSPAKFVEPITGAANERFLRNLEAFLGAAHRHNIAVNFTFFAFTPRVNEARRSSNDNSEAGTPPNPYLDPATVNAEKQYIVSVVERFRHVPWLSYDLINEPSFSNPRNIFHGNIPNGDPVEMSMWHAWLEKRYGHLSALADAWRVTESELGDWHSIPLPHQSDLVYERYGNQQLTRAVDYNLFAQDMFSGWVRELVSAIRQTGSEQLINIGQDEGGVTNRVLNQFYATAGVSFTTNHTYWQDDALLWDSVVAKRPGMPNITGETGYQPAWNPDGQWRYDELTGAAIEERKLALGFAAGSSGAMQWDWAREVDFGMQRSDGSAKVWQSMMRGLGTFAQEAESYATGMTPPEIAIILPQSLQMSTMNTQALAAQQASVRTLYYYNRVEAYAVGEFQTDTLGTPKLIILPSPYGLSNQAWNAIEQRVRNGAVLLASGPFDTDEHLHPAGRLRALGIDATLEPLQLRDEVLHTPDADIPLQYAGMTTTLLDLDRLQGGKNWQEVTLGKGKILFSTLPLEMNTDLASIAKVYAYAIKAAEIHPRYETNVTDHGILICPTVLPHATLYVLTSETESTNVDFQDARSGRTFSGRLEAGRAALLMVSERGELVANYNWKRSQ